MSRKTGFWKGSGLVLLAASGFGFHSSLVKWIFELGSNPVQLILYEFALAGLVFAVLMHLQGLKVDIGWRKIVKVLAWGGIGVGGTGVALYAAVARIPVALAIVLLFNFLPWVFLLEYLILKKKPTARRWIALGLIIGGTILATNLLETRLEGLDFAGIGFALIGALCYGSFIFGSRQLGGIGTPLIRSYVIATGVCFFFGFVGLTAPAEIFLPPESAGFPFWGLILILTLFGQIVPLLAFSRAIPLIGGSLAAIVASVELPIASVAAYLLLGERLNLVQVFGIVAILAAVVIANWTGGAEEGSF